MIFKREKRVYKPPRPWHVWFTEKLYANGWAPNFRYEMASGTKAEAVAKMRERKERHPQYNYRVGKYVRVEK